MERWSAVGSSRRPSMYRFTLAASSRKVEKEESCACISTAGPVEGGGGDGPGGEEGGEGKAWKGNIREPKKIENWKNSRSFPEQSSRASE